MIKELWCEFGKHSWQRESKRGPIPTNCPAHARDKDKMLSSQRHKNGITEGTIIELRCQFGKHNWNWKKKSGYVPRSCPIHAGSQYRLISKQWKDNNSDKVNDYFNQWRNDNPEKIKKYSRRYYENNKDREKKRSTQWSREHPEVARKRIKQWRKNNPNKVKAINANRRARRLNANGNITYKEFENICRQQNYKCTYCGEDKPLTMDHVQPLSKNGSHEASNIVGSCKNCNSEKHNSTLKEYLDRIGLTMDEFKEYASHLSYFSVR